MANILITIDTKTGLYSISLDHYEWTGLTVNGMKIDPNPDGGYSYSQKKVGLFDFKATSSKEVTILNPGRIFHLQKTHSSKHCYPFSVDFSKPGDPVVVSGIGVRSSPQPSGTPGPFLFSQGKMTGEYKSV